MGTCFINDLAPGFLNALEEISTPYAGDINSEDSDSILSALYYITLI
ncbi:MAG TPA: hypothetical protein VN414_09935 [Methanosarcina sp.]|nr:hypothetical protein [Methanosarcina sp.]